MARTQAVIALDDIAEEMRNRLLEIETDIETDHLQTAADTAQALYNGMGHYAARLQLLADKQGMVEFR